MIDNKFSKTPLDELPLTISYTPMQDYKEVYSDDLALKNGTLYPDLDKPFCAAK